MRSSTSKKPNGVKPTIVIACPHSDVCQAPARQVELMASLDEVSKSLGMVLEQQESLSERVLAVLGQHNRLAETVTVWKQREEEWLRLLGEVERKLQLQGAQAE